MLNNRLFRTLVPIICGYLTYQASTYLFELKYPLEPLDDLNTPGIVFLFEYILTAILIVGLFFLQYKVIVPRTFESISKAVRLALIIGLAFGLLFGTLNYLLDNAEFDEATITFFRALIEFNSFFLGILFSIFLMNWMATKNQNKEA